MRIVLQRVTHATVSIAGATVGRVGKGLVLLVGFTHADTLAEVHWMSDKIVDLRVFADDDGRMNRSIRDAGGELLVVSQFTLYGDASKGRRPSFVDAARPEAAVALYDAFVSSLRATGLGVATGEFGADMHLELANDGPVTLVLDRNGSVG